MRACLAEILRLGCEGRTRYPRRAVRMSLRARASEPEPQTTRVFPGGAALSADASERSFGTCPPAAGFALWSGRGSGQYAVRSMWASDGAAEMAVTAAAANEAAQSRFRRRMVIPATPE